KLQSEKDDLTATMIRRQADFENYRKRVEREKKEDAARALVPLIETLLPVLDAFERALQAHGDASIEEFRKGFELIHRQFLETLGRYGLERIPAKGQPFNPHWHQAVEKVETAEFPDHTVLEEMQAGYKLGDRVLRPTFVRVAVTPSADRSAAS